MINYFSSANRFPERKLEQIVFGFIFLIVALGVFFSHSDRLLFEKSWIGDKGWVEVFIIIGMILNMLVNIYRANILRPFRSNLFITCTWLLALAFFIGLGEKISWGQSFFDFQSPDFFVRYNIYGETNFRHLKLVNWSMGESLFDQLFKPIMIFYFLLLPFLYEKWSSVKKLVDQLGFPLARLYHLVAYVMVILLCEGMAGNGSVQILEFGGCWIILLVFCRPYNRKLFSRVSFKR